MSQFNQYPTSTLSWLEGTPTTTISTTGTYYTLNLDGLIFETFTGSNISMVNANPGRFELSQKGIYVFQFMFAFSGNSNDNYSIILKKSPDTATSGTLIPYTGLSFTTKGNGMWEVQNMFLINNSGRLVKEAGILTYKNQYFMQVKNNTDDSNITTQGCNILIYKIN